MLQQAAVHLDIAAVRVSKRQFKKINIGGRERSVKSLLTDVQPAMLPCYLSQAVLRSCATKKRDKAGVSAALACAQPSKCCRRSGTCDMCVDRATASTGRGKIDRVKVRDTGTALASACLYK